MLRFAQDGLGSVVNTVVALMSRCVEAGMFVLLVIVSMNKRVLLLQQFTMSKY
jgi:hypothetical protein